MGIRPTFTKADVEKHLQAKAEAIHQKILKVFAYVGESCVKEAREHKTYQDQTGNLTASIGYVVTYNGSVVNASSFNKVGGSSSGELGSNEGRLLADSIAQNHRQGYCLVVVAGMNYAYAVEARGLNVLSSAELLAEKLLPELLKALKVR